MPLAGKSRYMSVNKCCCIIAGINPERASTTDTTDNTSPESVPCKQLDYQDYADYFIVMSGDLLGNYFIYNYSPYAVQSQGLVQTFVRYTPC